MKKIIGILTATCFFVILSVSSYAQKTIEKPAKPAESTTTAPANTKEDKGDRVEKKGSRSKAPKAGRTKAPKVGRNQNGQDNINKTQRNSSGVNKSERTKNPNNNGTSTAPGQRKKTIEGKNRG